MPYNYLYFNENSVNNGIVSCSYFPTDLQSLYEQSFLSSTNFFGQSESDLVEMTVYDTSNNRIAYDTIVPKVTFNVLEGNYFDVNYQLQSYRFLDPSTNFTKFNNFLLLNPQNDLSKLTVSPGQYYVLYNPVRNVAGNSKYKMFIKEISPSRKELRLSIAFNSTLNDESLFEATKISTFANKKLITSHFIDNLTFALDNNSINNSFDNSAQFQNVVQYAYLLGLKSVPELIKFISDTYYGFNRVVTLGEGVKELRKFDGIKQQIKNFCYQYSNTEFASDELLEVFRLITAKISQERIIQYTSINNVDLERLTAFFIDVIYNNLLQINISFIFTNFTNTYYGLYKNALNFGDGNLIKILDHSFYFNNQTGRNEIQIKLDEPLSLDYNLKSFCWISNISLSPLYFKVNLFTKPVSKKVFLNGVNFSVNVNKTSVETEKFTSKEKETLFDAKSNLKIKNNDLLIDYNNFENFINYSSAELRTKIANSKINKFNSLEVKKSLIKTKANASVLSVSASYTTDYDSVVNEQISLLNTFDEYESHLFYNPNNINDRILSGSEYDRDNLDSLINQLPEYIRDDSDSEDYIKFTAMVGHFFDNILVFVKKFPKNYPINYNDLNDYPKNYIEELLNSLNWDTNFNTFENSSISRLLFNNSQISSSLSSSYFDYCKSILNRVTNNLPYIYKTKGTRTSLELIRNIFGIPPQIINIDEYGSADVLINRNQFYDFNDINYLTKYNGRGEYIKCSFTGSDFKYDLINSITSSVYKLTQSYTQIFDGISSVELSFRLNSNKYSFNDKILLARKVRNGNFDWDISITKTRQKDSGILNFNFYPIEIGYTSSFSTNELPMLNGNLFTMLLQRDVPNGLNLDNLPQDEVEVNNTLIISSSSPLRYVPFNYTLDVKNYDGSKLQFSSKNSKIIDANQNQYFGKGDYYFGNFSSSKQIYGNIDKIKIYKNSVLSEEVFNEHCYNINSISNGDTSTTYPSLLYLWSFDTPINLWPAGIESFTESDVVNIPSEYKNGYFRIINNSDLSISPNINSLVKQKSSTQLNVNFEGKYGYMYILETSIDQINWTTLKIYDFTAEVYVPKTINIPNQNSFYNNYFTAVNFTANETVTKNCVELGVANFPYQFEQVDLLQSVNINNFGPNYKSNVKINKIEQEAISNLVPSSYSTKNKDILGDDSNLIGFYFTPYNYLNNKIERFLGSIGIMDVIGNPANLNKTSYPQLQARRNEFAELGTKYVYPQEFITTFKFYVDLSVFDFVQQLKPSRGKLMTGLLLSPSIFDRQKVTYKNIVSSAESTQATRYQFSLDNKVKFDSNRSSTNDTSSLMSIDTNIENIKQDTSQKNFTQFCIPDRIDNRDFIWSYKNKYVDFNNNVFNVYNVMSQSLNDYYLNLNSNGNIIAFTNSFYRINLVQTGSVSNNGGFGYYNQNSRRHLSKLNLPGRRDKYIAILSNRNLVKKYKFIKYIKGKNDSGSTVDKDGITNGGFPIISIPGFLKLSISSSSSPIFGTVSGSTFQRLPLTASSNTSGSLETYINNL